MLLEYNKRKIETLRLIEIFKKEYNVEIKFVEQVESFESYNEKKVHQNKCFDCIHNRLLVSYNYADEHNYDYVSTTLTLGRLKNSNMINLLGEMLSKIRIKVFCFMSFRKHFSK